MRTPRVIATTQHSRRVRTREGLAAVKIWSRRIVEIPQSWTGKDLRQWQQENQNNNQ